MMTVNEVSKLTGVSIRTLQYYDTIGLLKPIEYTETGYRLYDDTSLERLQQIRRNIYRTIGLISIVLLVINIFYPLVFSVSDGRYQRGFAYIIFLIFAAFTFWTACICMLSVLKKMAI